MQEKDYPSPLDKLINYGNCREMDGKNWPNYPEELGITSEFIPELIRLATDETFDEADSDSLEIWAPVHAWRTLGQLHAEEAIESLLKLFEYRDNDWMVDELPIVYSMIGPKAIPALSDYLANVENEMFARTSAMDCLEKIAQVHPEHYSECVNILTQQLEKFNENDIELNAFLVSALVNLKAVESVSTIERAFESECVEEFISGDWEDVQIELGLKSEREVPRKTFNFIPTSEIDKQKKGMASMLGMPLEKSPRRPANLKAKAKQKQAKESRKKNRKKK